jgi:hypothetical protein
VELVAVDGVLRLVEYGEPLAGGQVHTKPLGQAGALRSLNNG